MAVQLQPEHQEIADKKLNEWIDSYVARTGSQPSHKAIMFVRNTIQRSMLPTSTIIKKMVEIGHKGMAARKPDEKEFDALGEELDRRLPIGELNIDLINEQVAKL